MDPNECFKMLLDAIKEGDREETLEHLENLKEWLEEGGFMPSIQE